MRKRIAKLFIALCIYSFGLYLFTYLDDNADRFFILVAPPAICLFPGSFVMSLRMRPEAKGIWFGFGKVFFAPMPPGTRALYFGFIGLLICNSITFSTQLGARELNGTYVLYKDTPGARQFVSPKDMPDEPTIALENVLTERNYGSPVEIYTEISSQEFHQRRTVEMRLMLTMFMIPLLTCALFYWFPRPEKGYYMPGVGEV